MTTLFYPSNFLISLQMFFFSQYLSYQSFPPIFPCNLFSTPSFQYPVTITKTFFILKKHHLKYSSFVITFTVNPFLHFFLTHLLSTIYSSSFLQNLRHLLHILFLSLFKAWFLFCLFQNFNPFFVS